MSQRGGDEYGCIVVLFDVEHGGRRVIREVIGTVAEVLYLPDVEAAARARCCGGRRSFWRRIPPQS